LSLAPLRRRSWFHEMAMLLSWSSLVSMWKRIGKWPFKMPFSLITYVDWTQLNIWIIFYQHQFLFIHFPISMT
jgi:hypothetical protein